MLEILTSDEMRQADKAAIASGITHAQLVEAAGVAVAELIKENFQPCPILFLCGPGSNGNDGHVAAARLKKEGWNVRVASTVKKQDCENLNSNLSLKDAKLVVDAVYGTGLNKPLDPELVTFFDKIRAKKIPVIAVDVPSGMNATTGATAAGALEAKITITFCRKKIAHMLYPSRKMCGKIHVAQIPVNDDTVASLKTSLFENHPALWLKDFPIPDAATHKYHRGHTVVYGGPVRTGAACLSAAAAQKIGSGLVTLTTPPSSRMIYALYRASIMVDEWQDAEGFKAILRDERKNCVVIGPGAGDGVKEAVEALLTFNKTAVLDADVFTAFSKTPQELFSKLSPDCVLTPHEGEFERLFGTLKGSKLDRARQAAKTSDAIILLKGPDSVIAAPDGTAIINLNASPALATGGSGDVLAGLIAGLAAQKMPLFMATAAACWLHGETAKIHGLGLTAEDIISHIPQVLNTLFTSAKTDR